jgi:uncharacterized protein (TIGR03435 family)
MAALARAAAGQEFEVVSVKPSPPGANGYHMRSNQGRLTASNMSLRDLIVNAYQIRDYQVEAPDWLASVKFDVAAKFPEALPGDREKYRTELGAMLQKMLADRFKLAIHRYQKPSSVYALVVMKKVKLQPAPEGPSQSHSNNTHYEGTSVTIPTFLEFLARRLDLPVVDMTDLKGAYNIKLDWFPEPKADPAAPAEHAEGPTLRDAIEDQLGLKLEMRKAPIETLVVDHVERAPTEN